MPDVLVYLDDIVIMSMNETEHLKTLDVVLQRLADAHLVLNPSKCQWVQPSVRYLGHQVQYRKIQPLPEYVSSVCSTPPPSGAKEARSFVGAVQWLHKYIPDCSMDLRPIQDCVNTRPFQWTPEAQTAFDKLVSGMSDLELGSVHSEGQIVLTSDASTKGYGSVLKQHLPDGTVVVLGFHSHAWSKTQQNWPARELELYAVLCSVRHFRNLIYGRNVRVQTDHKSLSESISPHKKCNTNKISNWLAELIDYDLVVEYIKGSSNAFADWLSRSLRQGTGCIASLLC